MPKLIIGASHSLFCARAVGRFEANWEQACTSLIPIEGFDGERHHLIFQTPRTRFVDIESVAGSARPVWGPMIAEARALNRPDVDVLLLVGGNEHNELAFCEHAVPWDFHLPDSRALDPSRQILALSAVAQILRALLQRTVLTLGFLRAELGRARLFYVSPPPPIPSSEHIVQNPEGFDMTTQRVAPAPIRLKVYRLFVAILEDVCRSQGLRFLPAPAEAVDAEGYLVERLWSGCTHAQPEFYQSMLSATEAR